MRTKPLIAVSTLVIALGACTGDPTVQPAPEDTSRGDVLVLDTSQGSVVVETGSGAVLAGDESAVASFDGSRLYTTAPDGRSTRLETIDSETGDVLSTTSIPSLPGPLGVRVSSVSGRTVAMMHVLPAGLDPWTPVPRSRTAIVVADPTGERPDRWYRLDGNYEPEAFSLDDRRLFLIQYLPAEAPSAYRVTMLDLAHGDVEAVHGRFRTPPERMPGERLAQVFDPVTAQLYTLYTNEESGYASSYWPSTSASGRPVTFVHVLNLRQGWAYCAGVPRRLWGQPASAQAMATSPDGRALYIVDSMRGIVSEIDTRTLKIVRTEEVDLGSLDGDRTSALMGPDGSTLFVGSARDGAAVYAIGIEGLRVMNRWATNGSVLGLGLSGDGARLYAAATDHLVILDADSGTELGTLPFQGVDSIVHVETPSP